MIAMPKNDLFIIAAAVTLMFSWSSCRKPERELYNYNTDSMEWDSTDVNATLAGQYEQGLYAYIPDGFNRISNDFLDAATDDALPSRDNTVIAYYTNGTVTSVNSPDPYFSSAYDGIRSVNIFLANIDRTPAGAARITYWKAEARFIRALMYFELLERYGGMPLVGDSVYTLADNLQLPRNTFAQTAAYIVNECDSIEPNLRTPAAIPSGQYGSATQGAAVALKCRVLLYAASPLYNGGGVESDQTIKELTGYPTADPSRWQAVINAVQQFQSLGYYALQSSFSSVFTTKSNTEIILAHQAANSFTIETLNAPVGYTTPDASMGYTSPTENLVDAFPMKNGLPVTDPQSGYDPTNPYTGRDPRLAASIFCNGAAWLSRKVQTFEGGLDKPNTINTVQTKTGYYLQKFMGAFTSGTAYSNTSHNFPVFRYAEILLTYAEALNEVNRTEDAVQQLILIRKRAGISAGTDGRYGIPAGIGQPALRTLIQNEWRIEFAFEERRFWDVRRWKIADAVLSGTISGARLTQDPSGQIMYNLDVPVANYVFPQRLYHMPIPYNEMLADQKLIQNEGW
jgi:hypothetical protein